jgi:uncharacterized protein YegP (UPF0339 family)
MPVSTLRRHLTAALIDFAWEEWAQLGVFAPTQGRSAWAQDPEALLVFTLEVARGDPRLFDEVLDWLHLNEQLVSHRRLRSLCLDDEDRRLVEAARTWLAWQRRPWEPGAAEHTSPPDPEPLFRDLSAPLRQPDPAFAQLGWLRPLAVPTGKSQAPDPAEPINLAFRLRHFMGVGSRSEVVRLLLTSDAPWLTAPVVARSAGYNRRNIQDTLTSLAAAGIVAVTITANEQRYAIDRARWADFLDTDVLDRPVHRDWPQLLGALRRVLRWLLDPRLEELSDYMLASRTRTLLEDLQPELAFAGVRVDPIQAPEFAWSALEGTIASALEALVPSKPVRETADGSSRAPANAWRGFGVEITRESDGDFTWRLTAPNGRSVAASAESFSREADAIAAANLMNARVSELDYDVYKDASGTFRWRARAGDGVIMAVSPGSFTSRFNAVRAVDRFRKGQSGRVPLVRHVVPNSDGGWDVQAPGAARASAHAATQGEAVRRAREIIGNSGGGELVVHNRDGRIPVRDTIGRDPRHQSPPDD